MRKRSLGFYFTLLACLCVSVFMVGCHKSMVKPGSAPVFYSDSRSVGLLPTTAMKIPIDMPQHLEGTFIKEDGSETSFDGDTWVRANDSILTVILFGGFGTTLAELTYVGDSVSFESSVMDVKKMKAEYVLADLQVCFYPFEALKENFEQSGFEFAEELNGDDFVRTLSENGKSILKVEKKGSEINLVNELRHYKYHITLGSN